MGRDKAQLSLGRITLLDRTVRELRTISEEVLVVGRATCMTDVRSLTDEMPGSGPAGGLITGLRAARLPLCLTVACDHPFLDAEVLLSLAHLIPGFDAVVPRKGADPQPLHAVYRRDTLPAAEDYFSRGGRSLRGLLDGLHVRWVSEAEMTRIDPSGRSLINVNTPEEWERAATRTEGTVPWEKAR